MSNKIFRDCRTSTEDPIPPKTPDKKRISAHPSDPFPTRTLYLRNIKNIFFIINVYKKYILFSK